MDTPITILGVDDKPANLLALEAVLEPLDIVLVKAFSGQEALQYVLEHDFALILLDVQMPEMDGFETASLIRSNKKSEQVPIIFVTAISFEKKYIFKGYDAGAVDYLFKPFDQHVLISKVKIFVELFRQKEKAKKRARKLEKANQRILDQQKELEKSEVRFRTAFDQSFQFMAILDTDGKIIEANALAHDLYADKNQDFTGRYLWDVRQFEKPDEKNILKESIKKAAANIPTNDETNLVRPDGTILPVIRTISPVRDEFGSVVYVTVQGHDISQIKQAEEEKLLLETQLRQAQKMEALGTLAGGIAHDFNNILSVVMGYAELANQNHHDPLKLRSHIEKIVAAANKARDLIQQILGFSRQAVLKKTAFKPSLAIKEAAKLLRASIPSFIDMRLDIDPECGRIFADHTQFHQILINLCTNAYHAMEFKPGILDICLNETMITEPQYFSNTSIEPGQYAHIQIKDTGIGMTEETVERIFDPYFTTKEIGKGTGMGLSIVHGIIKNHNGHIHVESAYGKGTTFHLYFPILNEASEQSASRFPVTQDISE